MKYQKRGMKRQKQKERRTRGEKKDREKKQDRWPQHNKRNKAYHVLRLLSNVAKLKCASSLPPTPSLPPSLFLLLLLPPTFSLPQRTSSSVTSFLCAPSLSSPIICKFLCPECNDVAWPPPKPEVLLLSHFLPSFPSLFLFFPLPFLASSLPSSCSSTSIPPPSFVFSF